jgi:two-component sensor histidine kinase
MTMALHELCTNAMKYGALSRQSGHVDLIWSLARQSAGQMLEMTWRDRGGPPVGADNRKGFGSRLMSRVFREFGSATTKFEPEGVTCRIELLIAQPQAPRVAILPDVSPTPLNVGK